MFVPRRNILHCFALLCFALLDSMMGLLMSLLKMQILPKCKAWGNLRASAAQIAWLPHFAALHMDDM
jgi:hypothetical protein